MIYENDLCTIQGNEYYLKQIANTYTQKREIWDREYVNGSYTSYGLINGWHYDYFVDDYVYGPYYGYGLLYGWHYEDRWIEISLDDEITKKLKILLMNLNFIK